MPLKVPTRKSNEGIAGEDVASVKSAENDTIQLDSSLNIKVNGQPNVIKLYTIPTNQTQQSRNSFRK